MSWQQAATLLTAVFVLTVGQAVLAGPLLTLQGDLSDTVGSNEHFDGGSLISGLFGSWFDMGLVGVFLLMGVAIARVVRRELTRRRGGGL